MEFETVVIKEEAIISEKVMNYLDEHEIVAASTGAFILVSAGYTLYRIGRGIHWIYKKVRH